MNSWSHVRTPALLQFFVLSQGPRTPVSDQPPRSWVNREVVRGSLGGVTPWGGRGEELTSGWAWGREIPTPAVSKGQGHALVTFAPGSHSSVNFGSSRED